ncbi:MAG TPA: thiaminase II, partial [Kandleria vitulina]|nr:thiaminase II [Kandleria vitulina]
MLWDNEVNNDFIVQMAKGVLDIERFKNYLMQDYFYLLDYLDILKKLKNMCVH